MARADDETEAHYHPVPRPRLHAGGWPQPGGYPARMDRLEAYDPVRVLFAHDVAVWERPAMPAPLAERLEGEPNAE